MRGDVLYAHVSRSLSLSLSLSFFSSLSILLLRFFLRLNSRSSSIYTYARLVDNDRQWRDFPLLCSLHNVKRKMREEEEGDKGEKESTKKKPEGEKNVDEQYSSLTRLVKCTMKSFLSSDRHRTHTHRRESSMNSSSVKRIRKTDVWRRTFFCYSRHLRQEIDYWWWEEKPSVNNDKNSRQKIIFIVKRFIRHAMFIHT